MRESTKSKWEGNLCITDLRHALQFSTGEGDRHNNITDADDFSFVSVPQLYHKAIIVTVHADLLQLLQRTVIFRFFGRKLGYFGLVVRRIQRSQQTTSKSNQQSKMVPPQKKNSVQLHQCRHSIQIKRNNSTILFYFSQTSPSQTFCPILDTTV